MALARFGIFTFDPESGTLSREGVPVRLQPQPAKVLALMIARAGEVVSRDELRAAIWGGETFVDFERGLNFCISQIRSALGDSADSPRYIETLPRRGYRFIAPVAAVPPVLPTASDRRLRRMHVPWTWMVVVISIVAGIAAAVYVRRLVTLEPVRIAVVPFDNETGDAGYDRVAVGIADATVARLAAPDRLEHVVVLGNSAVLRRPRSFRDIKAIGNELRVEYVVLAQMKKDAQGLRLIAHLIRVSDEGHVWAQTFDRSAYTLQEQNDIAEAIASAVATKLSIRSRS